MSQPEKGHHYVASAWSADLPQWRAGADAGGCRGGGEIRRAFRLWRRRSGPGGEGACPPEQVSEPAGQERGRQAEDESGDRRADRAGVRDRTGPRRTRFLGVPGCQHVSGQDRQSA